ncbi:basic secretory family protein [Zunongwangia mangrovi]|uniref:basic secretory family protein n=1 Tax=Zunongwangia mangrovi TaxID=1334022 RepID=UPI001FE0ABF5|nr:basic secretory family protein [Zunongwangia mangrovi]
MADYVRFKYGVDNEGAGWSLPDYNPENSYKNSYRITARFLYWLTKKYDKKIVQKLDKNMRNKTYSADLWNQYTGKSLDELWAEYSESPQIS